MRYISPLVAYKRFIPMHYLIPQQKGAMCWACARSWAIFRASAAMWPRPTTAFTPAAKSELRGFDVRGATPYGYVPTRVNFQLTNPDGSCVPRDPTNPEDNQCIQVPLPIYGIASIGGDTNLITNLEYRIPVVGPFTFSFFDDFGIDSALNHGQLKQSPEGFASLIAPLYGCPVFNNGACQGGIPAPMLASSRISSPSPAPTLFPACPLARSCR